ncbi:MAG TPA: hypothetical protein VF651_00705 [Gammaproteobacteria bacterium]
MPISQEEFVAAFPKLYHMAHKDSWPSIRKHGLLSTTALLDLFGIEGGPRKDIESKHRAEYIKIESPKYGVAMIRDQKPMSDSGLARCLEDGLTPTKWYHILNGRVFMWTSMERLETLMSARSYKKDKHLVLVFDSKRLMEKHWKSVTFCAMNSGCTTPFAHPRGKTTFMPPEKYPYAENRRRKGRRDAIVEVAVVGGMSDIENCLVDRQVISYGQIKSLK